MFYQFNHRPSFLFMWILGLGLCLFLGCQGQIASPDSSTHLYTTDPKDNFNDIEGNDFSFWDEPDFTEPEPQILSVVVLSDLNGSYGSTTYGTSVHGAVDAILNRLRPDLVLIAGDMVAGQQVGLDYAAMWSGFHAAVTRPLLSAGILVAPCPGNHDASAYPSFSEEREEYQRQWTQPEFVPKVAFVDNSHYPWFYSFRLKNVFFASQDATIVAPLAESQRMWLDGQLAQAQTDSARIVMAHVPIHPVTQGRETEIMNDLALEQVLANRRVDLFLTGHHHGYFPGVSFGVRQIGIGCLGSGSRALLGSATTSPQSLVLFQLHGETIEFLRALKAPDFFQEDSRAFLPEKLTFGNHELIRDDLAGY